MQPSADLPPRRALFFPVVLATVFLSIIGMSAGLVLGARHRQAAQNLAGPPPTTAAVSPSPTAPLCRPETQAMGRQFGADGPLRVVLKLVTRTSAVWICEDDAGRLYYHANRGGEDAPWIERKTALFMPDVQRDGDAFMVTATDGTTFSISAERLRIGHTDGTVETQKAVR